MMTVHLSFKIRRASKAASEAASALGPDVGGYRQECVELMLAARKLAGR